MPQNTVLLRKLSAIFALESEDAQAVSGLPFQVRTLAARSEFVREQYLLFQCCLLIQGIACRYRVTSGGT